METMIFTDPVALLDSVRKYAHGGFKIELCDNPMTREVGYRVGDSISWMISITNLKQASVDPDKKDLVELFKTTEGRLKVIAKLDNTLIPLRWIKNDIEGAKFAFGGGWAADLTYLGAPIQADFELSYENLAPYVTTVLDQAAPLEGAGLRVSLIEIKNGNVKVW